ncbi:lipopolysaccharide export system protein LptA precursor [mine drainage metagenome]|uniref:Lipopolysaccharide export system protein LptA n=1 Tax=mine drainage metagenome TaxID=410659 RepID=A0A1J5S119_9ZZZZ
MKPATALLILGCLLACPVAALAEKADRDKPVVLEADRITVDDAKNVHIFEGHVQLTQGTLQIRAAKLVVTQDADGFQAGVATGGEDGLAHFRQKRDGSNEYIEGEAERIEYDGKTDKAQFFLRAHIKSGRDEVSGQYISYDGKTENYLVTSGPAGTIAPSVPGQDNRVRAVIQPKRSKAPAKAAPAVTTPAQE